MPHPQSITRILPRRKERGLLIKGGLCKDHNGDIEGIVITYFSKSGIGITDIVTELRNFQCNVDCDWHSNTLFGFETSSTKLICQKPLMNTLLAWNTKDAEYGGF